MNENELWRWDHREDEYRKTSKVCDYSAICGQTLQLRRVFKRGRV